MALIELDRVTKAFYATQRKDALQIALSELSLTIEEGEFVSLLGPSGCGKTVTLNMIAGFDRPTMGDVRFKGEPVRKPGPERGVVFQDYSLLPWLSVEKNILYALKGTGLSTDEMQARTNEALQAVGLKGQGRKRPNLLSGGMKQRVAIARLLAMDSDVFLMDEPFSALDEQIRAMLDESLLELWRAKRKTVVFVTHSIEEAVRISSRIVLLSASPGRILGEWRIPDSMPRDPDSPEARALRAEISALFPSPEL